MLTIAAIIILAALIVILDHDWRPLAGRVNDWRREIAAAPLVSRLTLALLAVMAACLLFGSTATFIITLGSGSLYALGRNVRWTRIPAAPRETLGAAIAAIGAIIATVGGPGLFAMQCFRWVSRGQWPAFTLWNVFDRTGPLAFDQIIDAVPLSITLFGGGICIIMLGATIANTALEDPLHPSNVAAAQLRAQLEAATGHLRDYWDQVDAKARWIIDYEKRTGRKFPQETVSLAVTSAYEKLIGDTS